MRIIKTEEGHSHAVTAASISATAIKRLVVAELFPAGAGPS